MQGQLFNLLLLYALAFMAFSFVTARAAELEKEEKKRQAKREAQRKREMRVVGARVRRQLTVERFEGVAPKKKPVRKFCGVLATYDNQSIVK